MHLTDVEVRILGALIEKESTTPDAYPLSLNALTAACNQTSNRDPVMDLDEDRVKWAVNNLRQQSLVRAVQQAGSRVMKYRHLVAETLDLDARALAVLCVLMLRGAQTPGEIKGRTGRLADFQSVLEVQAALDGLIGRQLVGELPRRAGQKEVRFTHLLSGAPVVSDSATTSDHEAPVAPPPDRDRRIAELEATVESLRNELESLRRRFEDFEKQFG